MKPDRTNYEIWLIDYLDGTLDNIQAGQLMLFLDENPDIKEELADIFTCNLKPVPDSFKYKNSLKRKAIDLNDKQFEYLCIAAAENDLQEPQKVELEAIIAVNPEKGKIFDMYKRVVLVAPEVKFRYKSDLRKLTVAQKIVRLSVIGLSAAAGIALLFTLSDTTGNKGGIIIPDRVAVVVRDINKEEETPGKKEETPPRPPSRGEYVAIVAPFERKSAEERQPSRGEFQEKVSSTPSTPSTPFNSLQPSLRGESVEENTGKLDFRHDVDLAREIPWNITALSQAEIKSRPIIEKPGLNGLIARVFRERILKSKTPESGSLKGYEIADAGIIGLNKLFGWKMSLKQNRDQKGELKSLYFSSKILKFNAPVKKNVEGT